MIWLETLPDEWWNQYRSKLFSSQCIHELNSELLFIVRSLIIETRTYARACKRSHLLVNDFRYALDSRNIQQSVNLTQNDKNIISVSSIIDQTDQLLSKFNRLELTIHWLAIDGEQPIIPENPSPNFIEEKQHKINNRKIIPSQLVNASPLLQKLFELSTSIQTKDNQLEEHIHPLTKNNLITKPNYPINRSNINNPISSQSCLAHELSLEQQIYFKNLTESCFNETDKQQIDAFHCLSTDAALQPLVPRLLLFIAKGIETNIHLLDLSLILRCLLILKILTTNRFISFDKYLHSIIPSLLTCLICIFDMTKSNSTLLTINQNNYSSIWLMREQASDLISDFNNKYSTIPYLTERIVSIIKSTLINNDIIITFSIVYACIRTLLLIDVEIYGSIIKDILRNYKKLESDFDLDSIEQQTIFNQKINELIQKYNLILEDIQLLF
ncbi:unnamed protein product [Adineta steineri]|uniref:TAF6 C-terminal HEAT repeat domain-containing protein n=1 Tax=Adineta steineri TaxID=433720 RepID=A0A818S421_9BILA|nr:unnamed protein product [Adineta steineri]